VIRPETGVCSAICAAGQWFTTRSGIPTPTVAIDGNTAKVSEIVFGGGGVRVKEEWTFTVQADRILWQIDRSYLSEGILDDTYFPGWDFAGMETWTGGLLGTGGVVWSRYLDKPTSTYGVHTGKVTFWNRQDHSCLRIEAAPSPDRHEAIRFSRQPSNALTACFGVTDRQLQPRHAQARFIEGRDLWRPFAVQPGKISVRYTLQSLDYNEAYDRGAFEGLNGDSIRELLNTMGRYGVIDRHIAGANGWRSGYACLHEQWHAQLGLAVDDPEYIDNFSATLDHERDYAIDAAGRVKSRFGYDASDAMPDSWAPATGYYEAQWGYLLDSQPDYVMCVAEQFDMTGDLAWVRGQKTTCERVLEYMLRREGAGDGLLEALPRSRQEAKASDWIDIVWASHKNALLNAEMHAALSLWAQVEEAMGDAAQADRYRRAASRLKAAFNKPIAEGGFWNPARGWYVYWREPDGSIHGDNLVVPVNFCAIAYGLCDAPDRRERILHQIESRMQKEGLFHWPLCFDSFARDEVHANNWPFPKYENGDIFLSWGELGVRSYASGDPAIAVKYIKKVLDRYEADGLSFQRYLRQSQAGSGDDILAGNAMTIVGLYRDIYGIQPKYNRLLLAPHLTPELSGTQIRYWLRGQRHLIDLSMPICRIEVDGFSVSDASPFAVNAKGDALEFFSGERQTPSLVVTRSQATPLDLRIDAWPAAASGARKWTERGGNTTARHVLCDLLPGANYKLTRPDARAETVRSDATGSIVFDAKLVGPQSQAFELGPLP